jgi:hypothetical protein
MKDLKKGDEGKYQIRKRTKVLNKQIKNIQTLFSWRRMIAWKEEKTSPPSSSSLL